MFAKFFVDPPYRGMGLGLLMLLVPLQIVFGDAHGLNTLEHQPVKVAAPVVVSR